MYVSLVVILWLMISFIFTIVTSLSACGCYSHSHCHITLCAGPQEKGAAVCISTFACCIEIRFCESETHVTHVTAYETDVMKAA